MDGRRPAKRPARAVRRRQARRSRGNGPTRPSGPSRRARETWGDAPCDPRVRAAPACPRPPPVRRGRPAVGRRARLLQADRPLPRVRGGGPRRAWTSSRRGPRRRRSWAPAFRLACQARVERAERDVEFAVLRRRLRILLAPEDRGGSPALDPAVTVVDGRFRADDGTDLGPAVGPRRSGSRSTSAPRRSCWSWWISRPARILAVAALENPQRFGGSRRDDPDLVRRGGPGRAAPGAPPRPEPRAPAPVRGPRPGPAPARGRLRRGQPHDARPVLRPRRRAHRPPPVPVRDRDGRSARAGRQSTTRRPAGPRDRPPGQPPGTGHGRSADRQPRRGGRGRGPGRGRRVARGGSFLLVDIGTNTEIVASDGTRLLAASSPAGPAFEGGGVRYGMPGADGADRVGPDRRRHASSSAPSATSRPRGSAGPASWTCSRSSGAWAG